MPIPARYREALLTPHAARSVEAAWSFAADKAGETTILPDGRCDVIIRFNAASPAPPIPVLTGPATKPYTLTYGTGDTWVGVRLRPSFGAALWGPRLSGMVNQVLRGPDALSALPPLRKILAVPSAVSHVQDMLLDLTQGLGRPKTPASLSAAIDALHVTGGRMPIASLANLTGCTARQLGRQFTAFVGLPPKPYAGLIRAHRAVNLITGSGLTLTQVAYEAGYSDHGHMSRAVRQFTGYAPTDIPANLTLPRLAQ